MWSFNNEAVRWKGISGPVGWAGRLAIPTAALFPRLRRFPLFHIWKGLGGGAEFFRGYFKWFFLPAEGDERLPEWDLTFCMPQHRLPKRPIEFLPNEEELCFCTVAEFTENSPIFLLISWKTSSLRVCMGFSGRQLILSPVCGEPTTRWPSGVSAQEPLGLFSTSSSGDPKVLHSQQSIRGGPGALTKPQSPWVNPICL